MDCQKRHLNCLRNYAPLLPAHACGVRFCMRIPTESYQTIYDQYAETIAWMSSIGVNLGKGRTSHYDKPLKYWKDNFKSASDKETKNRFPDFVSSIFEIHEFIGIHESFKSVPNKYLNTIEDKLQKAVNGPIRASDESEKSTAARNFLFEAIIAARVHKPSRGVTAILNAKSDTGIKFQNKKLWVECKRVTSPEGIERNVRKASNQLESIFRSSVGSGHRGLIALEVSKIFNTDDKLLVRKNDAELSSTIAQITESFIRDYSKIWQGVFTEKNQKIIGVIVRTSYMATSEDRNLLVHVSDYGMNPRIGTR